MNFVSLFKKRKRKSVNSIIESNFQSSNWFEEHKAKTYEILPAVMAGIGKGVPWREATVKFTSRFREDTALLSIVLSQITLFCQKLVNENEIRRQIRRGIHEIVRIKKNNNGWKMERKKEIKVRVRVTRNVSTLNLRTGKQGNVCGCPEMESVLKWRETERERNTSWPR